jgi:hypothetical protein
MKTLLPILAGIALLAAACMNAPQQVDLFYYDPDLDLDASGNIQCSPDGLAPIQRTVDGGLSGERLIEESILLLIAADLTENERAQGLTTEYPLDGLTLDKVDLEDGVVTLSFSDPNFQTSGGACRVSILWLQIEQTVMQFEGVEQVQFEPAELFQP